MKKEILRVSHLTCGYQSEKPALKDVNVSIYQGEKIAVMGANGAGKSTFFLNLNGVLEAEQGEIKYQGEKIGRKQKHKLRRHVGFVFQDADSQMIASTVQAEISFGPMNMKLSREEIRGRVERALDYMDLQDYRDRPPHYLSGGEKKRVSIADIIAMETEVVLFDEPTAALDPFGAGMLEEVLEKLSREEKTLLISTHDVDFAYRWAQRLLVFSQGRLIADGAPQEIFQKEAILEQAHLKKPAMLIVYEALEKAGKIRPNSYPRQPQELIQELLI